MSVHTSNEIYFCPHSFEVFVFSQDKQKFRYEYEFPYVHNEFENKLLSVCLSFTWKSILVFRIHQNGSSDILQRKTKKMVETLQKIIINGLFKNCDQGEKFGKKKKK